MIAPVQIKLCYARSQDPAEQEATRQVESGTEPMYGMMKDSSEQHAAEQSLGQAEHYECQNPPEVVEVPGEMRSPLQRRTVGRQYGIGFRYRPIRSSRASEGEVGQQQDGHERRGASTPGMSLAHPETITKERTIRLKGTHQRNRAAGRIV